MSGEDWDARLFIERLRAGAYDGRIVETFGSLSVDQLHEVNELLAGDSMGGIMQDDTERLGDKVGSPES